MSKIFLASPVYREAPVEFVLNVRSALQAKIVDAVGFKLGDSLVSRARNNLTHEFLKSNCDYMLQIDSDIVFKHSDIEKIKSHDVAVVGGIYPIKEKETRWCLNLFPSTVKSNSDLIAVSETGTGFLLVRRDVFESIREDHPERSYKCDMDKDTKYDFWRVGVKNGRYLSEDWWFCQDARDAGYDVFVDTKITLGHIGLTSYPINEDKFSI